MPRSYFSDEIINFIASSPNEILGKIVQANQFALETTQRNAWETQISILQNTLLSYSGKIYLEYSIPRMGKRIDALLLIRSTIFILEFKVGESEFKKSAIDQVFDYALDLKYFHETSHDRFIAPILIATEAKSSFQHPIISPNPDKLLIPLCCNGKDLNKTLSRVLASCDDENIEPDKWEAGGYQPTPTIVEAALALYRGHSVRDISRSDAGAINLKETSDEINGIIRKSKQNSQKSICFVTGVPGAGKTLVGLNIATQNFDKKNDLYSVFLSGNGPLVAVLREALARDKVKTQLERGNRITRSEARRDVKTFIQNVHNFRDECLLDLEKPPLEHVALFDEAQRAWDQQQTANFMKRKKNKPGFTQSEPEFLISCLDRHQDWAVIVCLVGGGQEINTGEAGIGEWIKVLNKKFSHWNIYISSHLTDSEYGAGKILDEIKPDSRVYHRDNLHLAVSMRSFRSENVSLLVKQILDLEPTQAKRTYQTLRDHYPIVITRNVDTAKKWLVKQARGTERYGLLVSSQAIRLKPLGVDVRVDVDPIHWFLDGKDDIRSSFYLEDVATEFQVQGLELDWSCVIWDGDFRYSKDGWVSKSFVGNRWNQITKPERKSYLKNAYRVLLTRARQGMVIVVPNGDVNDFTRKLEYYDPTYAYQREIGLQELE